MVPFASMSANVRLREPSSSGLATAHLFEHDVVTAVARLPSAYVMECWGETYRGGAILYAYGPTAALLAVNRRLPELLRELASVEPSIRAQGEVRLESAHYPANEPGWSIRSRRTCGFTDWSARQAEHCGGTYGRSLVMESLRTGVVSQGSDDLAVAGGGSCWAPDWRPLEDWRPSSDGWLLPIPNGVAGMLISWRLAVSDAPPKGHPRPRICCTGDWNCLHDGSVIFSEQVPCPRVREPSLVGEAFLDSLEALRQLAPWHAARAAAFAADSGPGSDGWTALRLLGGSPQVWRWIDGELNRVAASRAADV